MQINDDGEGGKPRRGVAAAGGGEVGGGGRRKVTAAASSIQGCGGRRVTFRAFHPHDARRSVGKRDFLNIYMSALIESGLSPGGPRRGERNAASNRMWHPIAVSFGL